MSTNASYAPIHHDANQTSVSLVSVKAKINVNPLPNFTTQGTTGTGQATGIRPQEATGIRLQVLGYRY